MKDEYITPAVEIISVEDIVSTSPWGEDELPGDDWT